MENGMEKIDALLEKPCYIIDFLPEQVKPDNGGQFFEVEYYLLNSDKYIGLKDRFVAVVLKLMCYSRCTRSGQSPTNMRNWRHGFSFKNERDRAEGLP